MSLILSSFSEESISQENVNELRKTDNWVKDLNTNQAELFHFSIKLNSNVTEKTIQNLDSKVFLVHYLMLGCRMHLECT